MNKWLAIIIIVVAAGLGIFLYQHHSASVTTPVTTTDTTGQTPVTETPITTPDASGTSPSVDTFVRNLSVKGGDTVKSPLTITGEAINTWYFEGSFPVKVRDEYGVVLATVPAQAQSDWMKPGFVPFKATVTFTAPTTTVGFISLEKDNPSGDPAKDQAIIIPVRFK